MTGCRRSYLLLCHERLLLGSPRTRPYAATPQHQVRSGRATRTVCDSIVGQLAPWGSLRQPAFGVADAAGRSHECGYGLRRRPSRREVRREVDGGSKGPPRPRRSRRRPIPATNTATASPSATGTIRRSQGALSVSIVRSSSNPWPASPRAATPLNNRPAGSRVSSTRSAANASIGIAARLGEAMGLRQRGEQRLIPERVDSHAVAARRRRHFHHDRAPRARALRPVSAARG